MHPYEQQIRERAYFIWEGEGRIFGRATEHWLRAEDELTAGQPIRSQAAHAHAATAETGLVPSPARTPRKAAAKTVTATDRDAEKPAKPARASAVKSASTKAAATKTAAPKTKAAKADGAAEKPAAKAATAKAAASKSTSAKTSATKTNATKAASSRASRARVAGTEAAATLH